MRSYDDQDDELFSVLLVAAFIALIVGVWVFGKVIHLQRVEIIANITI